MFCESETRHKTTEVSYYCGYVGDGADDSLVAARVCFPTIADISDHGRTLSASSVAALALAILTNCVGLRSSSISARRLTSALSVEEGGPRIKSGVTDGCDSNVPSAGLDPASTCPFTAAMERTPCVYILASGLHGTLYCRNEGGPRIKSGVTNGGDGSVPSCRA